MRVVVLDWSCLLQLPGFRLPDLPDTVYSIPEVMIYEVTTSDIKERQRRIDKLRKICYYNADRMFIGMNCFRAIKIEVHPGIPLERYAVTLANPLDELTRRPGAMAPRRWRDFGKPDSDTGKWFKLEKARWEKERNI